MSVLILGAGWRVRRFVIPALQCHGIHSDQIGVLRRTATAEGLPDGIHVHTSLDTLHGAAPRLTLNCAPAEQMLDLQWSMLRRFPKAMHLCDTPIFASCDSPDHVPPTDTPHLFSLEDWPATPNLDLVRQTLQGRPRWDVRIEHFGIATHFLAFVRGLATDAGLEMPRTERNGDEVVCQLDAGRRATLVLPKNPDVAKVFMRCEGRVVEDFFEVAPEEDTDEEVLVRTLSREHVRYRLGRSPIGAWTVDPAILDGFQPLSNRKNVHELDKFIALIRIFAWVLTGTGSAPYRYAWSAEDAQMARRLNL